MTITPEELLSLGQNAATIIDVGRHAGSREIRGAIRYRPSDLLTADHLVLPIAAELPVVLYAEHDASDDVESIGTKLRASGYADVRILAGGFAAYEKIDGPMQEASLEQVVPPTKPAEVPQLDRRV